MRLIRSSSAAPGEELETSSAQICTKLPCEQVCLDDDTCEVKSILRRCTCQGFNVEIANREAFKVSTGDEISADGFKPVARSFRQVRRSETLGPPNFAHCSLHP